MMKSFSTFILCLFLFSFSAVKAQEYGYYRFPAIHGNTVIFTAEGDLWKYNLNTGESSRLTTNHGQELHASISPDGNWVAFTGQYEGPAEVYVMPLNGGRPKRLTYEEGSPIVYQWTPDNRILYSTASYSTLPNAQLIKINPADLTSETVPLAQADQGTYAPDGTLFFTRLRFQGSNTKRYKGGTAQTLWKYDGRREASVLTGDYPGTSKNPMYYNGRIYFLSDRDGTMNIWSMNTEGSDLKQHTRSAMFNLEDADLSQGKIVCRQGADIVLYDINKDVTSTLTIKLNSDFDQRRIQWINNPKSKITAMDLSNKGDYVAITSRGRVFSVPAEGARWSEVTRKYGIRYGSSQYMNNQNDILFLSDESGEMEIWKTDNYGFKPPEQLTSNSNDLIVSFQPSPDGNYIVFNEKDNRLKLYSAKTKNITLIAENNDGFTGPFAWSPDSRWMAFRDVADNEFSFIRMYDVETEKIYDVTSKRQESYNPEFSRDNNWLYFISDRTFKTLVSSPWGSRQPEPYYDKTARIYAVALNPAAAFPFREMNELITASKTDSAQLPVIKTETKTATIQESKKKPWITPKKLPEMKYDLTDPGSRLYVLPVKAANIRNFHINNDWIYWSESNTAENTTDLKALKISGKKKEEPVVISQGISLFTLSGDGKKILIRDKNGIMVLNADGTKPDAKKNSVDLSKWAFNIDPVEDWNQMFDDAWRMERDYFYDKNMHGVDWKKVYEQYKPLVARVTDRFELDDILAQMISELSALHMFVSGGDKRAADDTISNGFLGAKLRLDGNRGGYVIDHIYRSDPDYPEELSPLAKPGLKIHEGDVITEVNGDKTIAVNHINSLLQNKSNMQVRLKLKRLDGQQYDEIVTPVSASAFSNLRYNDWEYSRRLITDSLSGSKIGYLHLRAMSGADYDQFQKSFYSEIGKEGLIIDMRHNRGGNIDSWLLEKLMRKAWFYWAYRTGKPEPNMQLAFTGHLVVLMDENTASDGEAFSEGFRRLKIGQLIGTRTWGGEIWLTQSNRLVDNGVATAAENGVYSPEGEWLIEGWGVEPDIRVDNLPHETFIGKDSQLEAGINHLQKLIKEKPVVTPPVPAYPDKSFKYRPEEIKRIDGGTE